MDFFNMAVIGGAVGLLASFWGQLKGVLWKLFGLFVSRAEIHSDQLAAVVLGHLVKKFGRSQTYDRVYQCLNEYYRRNGRSGMVAYENFGTRSLILWRRWIPFVYTLSKEAAGDASGGSKSATLEASAKSFATFTYLRGTLDIEGILAEAVRGHNEDSWGHTERHDSRQRRFFVQYVPEFKKKEGSASVGYNWGLPWYQLGTNRTLGVVPEELGLVHDDRPPALAQLVFPPHVLALIEDIKMWRENRDWYKKRGIMWRRGWLVYGPPGTGKTRLARAFAEDLDLPIFVFNLAELGNFGFLRSWMKMKESSPCIALIEDFDNVFHGRENVARRGGGFLSFLGPLREDGGDAPDGTSSDSPGGKKKRDDDDWMAGGSLTFDCFLNALDGVEENDGVFVIVTTNCLEHIDPALGCPRPGEGTISTRPGRLDRAVELTYMRPEDKAVLARRILGDYPEALGVVLAKVETDDAQETPAQFQEYCSQEALRCFWEQKREEERAASAEALPERNGHTREYPKLVG